MKPLTLAIVHSSRIMLIKIFVGLSPFKASFYSFQEIGLKTKQNIPNQL
jgi:hypothetical protein